MCCCKPEGDRAADALFRFGLPFVAIAMLSDEFGYLDPSTHLSLAHQTTK